MVYATAKFLLSRLNTKELFKLRRDIEVEIFSRCKSESVSADFEENDPRFKGVEKGIDTI